MKKQLDVLVVEDSPTQALQLQLTLEAEGYRVDVARNGIEGIKKLESQFYPVILTDWIMPEMDGFEFCRTVRQHSFEGYIYIMLLTTQDSIVDIVRGLRSGADDYLVKPVHPAELTARLMTAERIITLETSLKKRNEEIARLSITDPLTGTFNRRYLTSNLKSELKRAARYGTALSIFVCDIDHFKRVNDRYGHLAGDRVLKEVAETLKESVRRSIDWVARYGGEEFVVVLPETDFEAALETAERLREAIARREVAHADSRIKVTVSFGVSTVAQLGGSEAPTIDELFEMADRCLYQAKEEGRNRCQGSRCGQSSHSRRLDHQAYPSQSTAGSGP